MLNVNITFQVNEKETASIKYHLLKYLTVEPEDIEVFNQVGAESIDGHKIDVQIVKDYKFAPVFDGCRNISLFSLYYGQTKDSSVGKIDSIIEMCMANDLGTVKLGADLLYNYSCQTNEENVIKFVVLNSLSLSNKVGEQIPLFENDISEIPKQINESDYLDVKSDKNLNSKSKNLNLAELVDLSVRDEDP